MHNHPNGVGVRLTARTRLLTTAALLLAPVTAALPATAEETAEIAPLSAPFPSAPPAPRPLPPASSARDGALVGTVVWEGKPSLALFKAGDAYFAVPEGCETPDGSLLLAVRTDRIVVEVAGRGREVLLFTDRLRYLLPKGGHESAGAEGAGTVGSGSPLESLGPPPKIASSMRDRVRERRLGAATRGVNHPVLRPGQ